MSRIGIEAQLFNECKPTVLGGVSLRTTQMRRHPSCMVQLTTSGVLRFRRRRCRNQAYDLSVFLWNCVLFERKDHTFWHAFIEGYRTISELSHADLEAVHLFVPIRHIWLVGEYASRIHEWGRQAVPADWIAAQLDFMLS